MTPTEERNEKLGEGVVKALRARHFDAIYCKDADEARMEALARIPEGASVFWGGSMTIRDIGLTAALKAAGDREIYDRETVPPAARMEYLKEHYFSDFFLGSANALTEDGIILNMDGSGNRVAAMIWGPKKVILLVGMNKVVRDFEAGVARVRSTAAPINAQRFDIDTPCKKTGRCADCKSPDSLCGTLTAMRLCRPAGRITVILFGENYGY